MKKESRISQKEFTQSIWRQTKLHGDWLLLFESRQKRNGMEKAKFDLTKPSLEQKFKMGSIIITEHGFYKLLKIDGETATILDMKNNNKKENIAVSEISNIFEVFLFLPNPSKNWYKITLQANGNMEELIGKINSLGIVNSETNDYILMANGQLLKEGLYYDQVGLRPKMKILLATTQKKENTLKRFEIVKKLGWYQKDHVVISTNKKMRISGVGINGPCQGVQTVQSTLKLVEGLPSNEMKILVNEEMVVNAGVDLKECVTRFMFKNPIVVQPFKNYSIVWQSTLAAYYYFGTEGKNKFDVEKSLVINLHKEVSNGNLSNAISQVGRGIISEINYIV